jgi:hypothetical protein
MVTLDPKVQEGTQLVSHHPLGHGMVRVRMKGTHGTSFGPRMCAVVSRAGGKIEIGQSRSNTTREITTCMILTTTNLLSVAPWQEPSTQKGSNCSCAT